MFDSDRIAVIVKDIVRNWNVFEDNYHIDFGEDFFSIVFTGKNEIFSDMVNELQESFRNECAVLIQVDVDGNLVLVVDIPDDTCIYDIYENYLVTKDKVLARR